ncbi:MAG: glycosyltransferase [Paludibacteraceae bacterium]|nr:glycosyltransferase [Paludibacteraceae bacterium]
MDLPPFDGTTILTVTSSYPHKNLPIMAETCSLLESQHPDFRFRFAITLSQEQCPFVNETNRHHFLLLGKVDIAACPSLYEQADVMLMPSLLECFSATYPEAMRMQVPIVTSDLEFARGLCGPAAAYYEATNAQACADSIYRTATDRSYAAQLTESGTAQLKRYDNYEQRADKLIALLEKLH